MRRRSKQHVKPLGTGIPALPDAASLPPAPQTNAPPAPRSAAAARRAQRPPARPAVPAPPGRPRPPAPQPWATAARCWLLAPQTGCPVPPQWTSSAGRDDGGQGGEPRRSEGSGSEREAAAGRATLGPDARSPAHLGVHGARQEGCAAPGSEGRGSGGDRKPGAQRAQGEGAQRVGTPHGCLRRAPGAAMARTKGRAPVCASGLPLARDTCFAARSGIAAGDRDGLGRCRRRAAAQRSVGLFTSDSLCSSPLAAAYRSCKIKCYCLA